MVLLALSMLEEVKGQVSAIEGVRSPRSKNEEANQQIGLHRRDFGQV